MILIYLILILLAGALLAWISGNLSMILPRIFALITLSVDLIWLIIYLLQTAAFSNKWLIDVQYDWIPQFGIGVHFALDWLSLLMLLLTFFLGIISVLISDRKSVV